MELWGDVASWEPLRLQGASLRKWWDSNLSVIPYFLAVRDLVSSAVCPAMIYHLAYFSENSHVLPYWSVSHLGASKLPCNVYDHSRDNTDYFLVCSLPHLIVLSLGCITQGGVMDHKCACRMLVFLCLLFLLQSISWICFPVRNGHVKSLHVMSSLVLSKTLEHLGSKRWEQQSNVIKGNWGTGTRFRKVS